METRCRIPWRHAMEPLHFDTALTQLLTTVSKSNCSYAPLHPFLSGLGCFFFSSSPTRAPFMPVGLESPAQSRQTCLCLLAAAEAVPAREWGPVLFLAACPTLWHQEADMQQFYLLPQIILLIYQSFAFSLSTFLFLSSVLSPSWCRVQLIG